MFERIKKYFSTVEYRIVELPAVRTQARWGRETKDAVATLPSHPGFVALMDRLRLTKAALAARNNTTIDADEKTTMALRIGQYWLGWIEQQVADATANGSSVPYKDALQEELDAFRDIDRNIERIG